MKASLKWLRAYTDFSLAPQELARRLTMAGHEVKAVQTIGEWESTFVSEVVSVESHPQADRLKLVTVSLGTRRKTVVCGAANYTVGDRVPLAEVGAKLVDGHTGEVVKLSKAKIRGVVSEGMLCSEKELGISDEHEGIMILPADAPPGVPLRDYLGDVILDLDITPNRPDCLSIVGIAREVAAIIGGKLHLPDVSYAETGGAIESLASVAIAEPGLCPRYCASLILGVKIAPSPRWLSERLAASGMRPINNVVDITNYVMMEYGQPLHSFDYDALAGRQIVVRRAYPGEKLTTLDGSERELDPQMLVIADRERPVALAGVMGGLASEVSPGTVNILLESANFARGNLRRTSQALGLSSEASLRFEKGLSIELPPLALRRATQLILEVAGGQAASGIVDVYPGKRERIPVELSLAEFPRLLGMEVAEEEVVGILGSLGFDCRPGPPGSLLVSAPWWRTDIKFPADLVEEVSRMKGYEGIPVRLLGTALPARSTTPMMKTKRKLRDIMVGFGFQEVLTYSLTAPELLAKSSSQSVTPVRVVNPLSPRQEYLRTTLRGNVLAVLAHNQRHATSLRLFELGKVFLPVEKDLPRETEMLCAVLAGKRQETSWRGGEDFDFFSARGMSEAILASLGVKADYRPGNDDRLRRGRQATMVADGVELGIVGELHPLVARDFDIDISTYLVELDLESLLSVPCAEERYSPIPRFPASVRDMALIAGEGIGYKDVQDIVTGFPLVSQASLFDVYRGEQVPAGKKSLALRVVYQSPDRTLSDEEVDGVQRQILDKLSAALGISLRS
ncbi:MAG: phenylalanine--tRNA ligase subunit beta [Chloroflexota bacterium]